MWKALYYRYNGFRSYSNETTMTTDKNKRKEKNIDIFLFLATTDLTEKKKKNSAPGHHIGTINLKLDTGTLELTEWLHLTLATDTTVTVGRIVLFLSSSRSVSLSHHENML
jgi:hypothetical protein